MHDQSMDRLRRRLTILDDSKVSIKIANSYAAFTCEDCDDLLDWLPDAGWWACPSCQFELTPNEAGLLADRAVEAAKQLGTAAYEKGGRWKPWWKRLFR